MDERKDLILKIIIKEYIKTGIPVGSRVLVDKYKLDISPATVRNEMMELENKGYIVQPHTSAGRIPTESAYEIYLNDLNNKEISKTEKEVFERILKEKDEQNLKQAAKTLAKMSNNAVFWAFSKNNLYYTGISNLLQQPEFVQVSLIYNISSVIDRADEIINEIFDNTGKGSRVLIGSQNPFGNFFGTVLSKYRMSNKTGLFGILGPIRMDYGKNLSLVEFINNKITK